MPNKNVLITGGSRGIGKETAIIYAENFMNVHFIYKNDTKNAYDTLKKMINGYFTVVMKELSFEIGTLWINKKIVDNFLNEIFDENFKKNLSNYFLKTIPNKDNFIEEINSKSYFEYKLYKKSDNFLDELLTKLLNLSTNGNEILEKIKTTKCRIYKGDIADKKSVDNFVDNLIGTVGKIDFLVSNAGIDYYSQIQDINNKNVIEVINTNLLGTINICSKVSPYMIEQKYGKIVAVSSMHGLNGSCCESVYSATKGGIIAFIKSLAKELGPSNINCNIVAPGVVMTDMMKGFSEEEIENLRQKSTLCRVSSPRKIAQSIYFLTSEEASDYNGKVFSADCGFIGD